MKASKLSRALLVIILRGLSWIQTFARGSEVEVELFSFQLCLARCLAEFFLLRGRGNGKISNLYCEIDIRIKIDTMLVSNQPSTQNIVTIVTLLAKYRRKKARLIACLCKVTKPHHYRKRVTWEAFLQDMLLEEDFETTTRMPSLHAFYELCNLLSPFLSSSKRSYVSIKRNISIEFKLEKI